MMFIIIYLFTNLISLYSHHDDGIYENYEHYADHDSSKDGTKTKLEHVVNNLIDKKIKTMFRIR